MDKSQWIYTPLCAVCSREFNFFHRRHHCRKCGSSVCSSCSFVLGDRFCLNKCPIEGLPVTDSTAVVAAPVSPSLAPSAEPPISAAVAVPVSPLAPSEPKQLTPAKPEPPPISDCLIEDDSRVVDALRHVWKKPPKTLNVCQAHKVRARKIVWHSAGNMDDIHCLIVTSSKCPRLRIGDVITKLNGESIEERFHRGFQRFSSRDIFDTFPGRHEIEVEAITRNDHLLSIMKQRYPTG